MAESFSSGGITRAVDHGISQESRIVLGIDYGTTYTGEPTHGEGKRCRSSRLTMSSIGLAWMQTKAGENESLDDLTVFINWPEKDAQKVPSEFSYSRSIGKKQQWGYSMSADADVIKWTKLELESRTTVRELEVLRELVKGLDLVNKLRGNENAALTNDIPRHLSRSAEDVVRDYLCKVSREWHRFIKGQAELVLDTVPLDIVLTHPAVYAPFSSVLECVSILTCPPSRGRMRLRIRLSEPLWGRSPKECFPRAELSRSRPSQKHVLCTTCKIC